MISAQCEKGLYFCQFVTPAIKMVALHLYSCLKTFMFSSNFLLNTEETKKRYPNESKITLRVKITFIIAA